MLNRLRSLRAKLMLAFLGVALVAVGVLGLLVGRSTSGAFEQYLISRQTGDLSAMDQMMDEMMGPEASQAAMEQMLGPAERAYLAAINSSLWLTGGLAALVAVALGLLFARQIAGPVRALTTAARRLGAGDLDQRVPVRGRRDELGELAEAFNSMAEAVGRQEMLRRQMAADIAHELRTPLAVIQANLEAMLDGIRPLSAEEVADVHRETQLLSRLVTDLRDLSLVETGQLLLRKELTDLTALVRTSVARFSSRAEEKDVRLVVEAEDSPQADVDPDRVVQVLGNLLDNALRHTPPGGEVVVRLEFGAQRDEVRVTVRDTGPGIPEEHLPNIFERFYRADRARTRTDGGSGIGLAVVKQLVEAHGGRVWAESRPGEGTTFGFVLPVAGPGTPETASPRNDEGWSPNGSAR